MNFHIYHHYDELEWIAIQLDEIRNILKSMQRKEVILMKEVDDLVLMVEETKGIDESTEAAVDAILAYQAQILAQIGNTVDPVVIKGLTDKLAAYNAALAAKKDALLAAIPINP
jgi:hypothetical protein